MTKEYRQRYDYRVIQVSAKSRKLIVSILLSHLEAVKDSAPISQQLEIIEVCHTINATEAKLRFRRKEEKNEKSPNNRKDIQDNRAEAGEVLRQPE